MPAFRSTGGSRYCSRSCWPGCSRKARSCAKTSKGQCDMAIAIKLDDILHDRRMTLTELADRIGMALANLSILKTGKARARRSRASLATFFILNLSKQHASNRKRRADVKQVEFCLSCELVDHLRPK